MVNSIYRGTESLGKRKKNKVSFYCKLRKGDVGKITIHQVENESQNKESVASMHDWLTACDRFSTIYCIKYPDQQAWSANHLEAVSDIADTKGNWKGYETDFRMLVAQGQVEWSDVYM